MAKSSVPPVGFLGAGKMATALARGWIAARLLTADQVLASDPVPKAREHFTEETGAKVVTDNRQVVEKSEVLVVAVKPHDVPAVLTEISPLLDNQKHLLISIAAGVTLGQIGELVGRDDRVVRVMPNTPALVGASASAYAHSVTLTPKDLKLVDRLLSAVGRAYAVPEKMLDAVTGLSGSGPAFVFVLIEALSDGGVRMGLPRDIATALAAQTVMGAAKMTLETGKHPGALKDMVASPAGTTIAGLHVLERRGFRGALMDAVEAATLRAEELGKK